MVSTRNFCMLKMHSRHGTGHFVCKFLMLPICATANNGLTVYIYVRHKYAIQQAKAVNVISAHSWTMPRKHWLEYDRCSSRKRIWYLYIIIAYIFFAYLRSASWCSPTNGGSSVLKNLCCYNINYEYKHTYSLKFWFMKFLLGKLICKKRKSWTLRLKIFKTYGNVEMPVSIGPKPASSTWMKSNNDNWRSK